MIQSIQDVIENVSKTSKIIVLYSGGLDGTYLLTKLKEEGFKNILALHINIEGTHSSSQIDKRLKQLGIEAEILDLTDEFINNYLIQSIYTQARYLGGHPLSASLSRPLIAKHSIEHISRMKLSNAIILHTSNSSQNSLRRFNNSFKNLSYAGQFGSPFEKTHITRPDKLKYLHQNGIALDLKKFSEDSNIWCREFEYGDFDNIENIKIPEDAFVWTKKEIGLKDEMIYIQFESGIPVAINHQELSVKEIIIQTRKIVGKYGIGRHIGLEEIESGKQVLEVREAPSATILMSAYKHLELATISSDTSRIKLNMEQLWVREASEGRWFEPLRNACGLFCKEISKSVSGIVSYELSLNSFQLVTLKAEYPNYIVDRDSFEDTKI